MIERLSGRRLCVGMLVALAVSCCFLNGERALADKPPHAAGIRALSVTDAASLQEMLALLPVEYASAHPTHDPMFAAIARQLAQGARARTLEAEPPRDSSDSAAAARALTSLGRLVRLVSVTAVRFQPWPLAAEVSAAAASAQHDLEAVLPIAHISAAPYSQIGSALDEVRRGAAAGDVARARFALLRAYTLYGAGPGRRLQTLDSPLADQITQDELLSGPHRPSLAQLLADGASATQLKWAVERARSDMNLAAQTLGEVRISRATIVANAAIIVFREGLEAVLILAAITASFVGARRHLRRPIMIGAFAGLVATALTWVIAQVILHLLGNGGLQLQVVTGLIAIGVLLLVTNWFFHRVYWSEWISRFNRRRKAVERWEGIGFISGQVLGFMLLGLSSVYREGLETVLFLQALQTSAGTQATLLGAGIGLSATLLVGVITFKLQRKLPYKRMLIVTGILIALVLAVMVGTTVHNMQGIGWAPTTPTSFSVPLAWSTWLGVYPTWEGIGAQLFSLVFVIGSYFAAREIQLKRQQRGVRRESRAIAPTPASQIGT